MRHSILILALSLCAVAQASWYWPFDHESDTNAPPRLHRLLEKANDYIELAEDQALEGEGDKAIELYRQALDELDRVERENPDRAEKPEFAPLRNKRATCAAAIDAIRFAQVEENERAVTVTDTRELQKKWRKKHGLANPQDNPEKKPSKARMTFEEKRQDALAEIRRGDFEAADLILSELLKERSSDLHTLLLRAVAQIGLEHHEEARRALERAMRAHPKSYLPYYNLAALTLKLGEDVESAREYYEMGRQVGGPVNPALEKKFTKGKVQ